VDLACFGMEIVGLMWNVFLLCMYLSLITVCIFSMFVASVDMAFFSFHSAAKCGRLRVFCRRIANTQLITVALLCMSEFASNRAFLQALSVMLGLTPGRQVLCLSYYARSGRCPTTIDFACCSHLLSW